MVKVKISEVEHARSLLHSQSSSLKSELGSLSSSMTAVPQSQGFVGATQRNMTSYTQAVHANSISLLIDNLSHLDSAFNKLLTNFRTSVDTSSSAVLDDEVLSKLESKLTNIASEVSENISIANKGVSEQRYASCSHVSTKAVTKIENANTSVKNTQKALDVFNGQSAGNLKNLSDSIGKAKKILTRASGHPVKDFTTDSINKAVDFNAAKAITKKYKIEKDSKVKQVVAMGSMFSNNNKTSKGFLDKIDGIKEGFDKKKKKLNYDKAKYIGPALKIEGIFRKGLKNTIYNFGKNSLEKNKISRNKKFNKSYKSRFKNISKDLKNSANIQFEKENGRLKFNIKNVRHAINLTKLKKESAKLNLEKKFNLKKITNSQVFENANKLKEFQWAGKIGKVTKVTGYVGTALDTVHDFNQESKIHSMPEATLRTGARLAVSTSLSASGQSLGAEVGAAFGTALFPGVGTVAGGVIGGFLGSMAGAYVAKKYINPKLK